MNRFFLKMLTVGLFCVFLILQSFCGGCLLEFQGRIIGDRENYRTKVIYASILTSDTTLPNSGYKVGMDKKDLDSICQGKALLILDSTGSYHKMTSLDLSDWSSCPNKVNCFSKIWPNFIRIKVYDQKKLKFVIDTIFSCSECNFSKRNSEIWDLFIPDLYLK